MLSKAVLPRAATLVGSRSISVSAQRHGPTLAGAKDLVTTHGRSWLAIGGVLGSTALVSPVAAVCVGSLWAAAHVVDLAVNDDFDDLVHLPKTTYTHLCGPAPNRKRVVVLGSGWGALSFVRKLDPMRFDVTIVSPRNYFFYTPLLAGVTTSTVKAHSVLEAVRQTKPLPYATFLQAECTNLDAAAKTIECQDNGLSLNVPYDHLVVAVGTQPNTFGIPGVKENAMFLKELDHGLAVRQRILNRLERAVVAHAAGRPDEVRRLLTVAVVGGGPTGVEFAAEVADLINSDVKRSFPTVADQLNVTLVEAQSELLGMFEKSIGEHVRDHLVKVGVKVLTQTMVKSVDEQSITLKTSSGETETFGYGMLVWVAGVGARPITQKLAANFGQSHPRGLEVDEFLRVKGSEGNDVFAIGDCAVGPYAWTAQVAAQQGKYLARAFRDEEANASKPFKYNHQGTMAYVGDGEAVAVLTPPETPRFAGSLANASFFRQLASCPDSLLKPEHRMSQAPAEPAQKPQFNVLGLSGFAVWRGVYFTKLFSYSNRFNVATDWLRNFFFGRVVASSVQTSREL
eukprot:TRINITY_DN3534_c0_g2_i1.p1 TRINITY_DN3534_c0_g2~~TRINITY_DN3534_c0_g2_i1.p1  ORF type:complete len:569 (-),score=72.59 TRINITY_DN3534_c0_g2_i1:326-2032(-)